MTNVRRTDDKNQIFIVCPYLTMFFRAAPDLLDYIDYENLGNALKDSWNDSCYYYDEDTDCVVSTAYGF